MENHQEIGPQVKVQQISQVASPSPQQWVVTWNIQNAGDQPLQILSALCPHGRFRAGKVELSNFPVLMSGRSTALELPVTCDESPGIVVENTFLILQAEWRGQLWQILIRLTMTFDQQGAPNGHIELITTQPIGFSRGMRENEER